MTLLKEYPEFLKQPELGILPNLLVKDFAQCSM